MRFLLRFLNVAHMVGVDATPTMLDLARKRAAEEGCLERVTFVQADVCSTGLPENSFDFAWGEDAWCYVGDKLLLIREAVRIVRSGGTLAFTDWMLGPEEMTSSEAEECLQFMKFPSLLSLVEYIRALERCGCVIRRAADTGRFVSHVQLYLDMAEKQLGYDILKLIGFDSSLLKAVMAGMRLLRDLALHGKIIQGMIVAAKL